ncbi:MAG: hypothetical protein MUF79_09135 [Burkholderiales bacterium]|jgi:hypothetical protein|nr:hypothetical protein [Burkholderiales bacterium]
MAEERNVHIVEWPASPARLTHAFDSERPAPVSVRFEASPASVRVATAPGEPLDVNMNMLVSARQAVPLCIKLCEPICLKSDYEIGITLFDRPIITISVRGLTRIYNCGEER